MADRRIPAAVVAAGIGSLVLGTAYGAEKAVLRRIRRTPDPDRGRLGLPAPVTEHTVIAPDGSHLHVIEVGQGPPIVLLHGVMLSVATWVKQLRLLPAAGFRVLAVDHAGHGASTCTSGTFGAARLADDLKAVLEDLDLTGAVVVGHSMGGMALLQCAVSYPAVMRDRVAGIVLMSTMARVHLGVLAPMRGFLGPRNPRLPDFGMLLDTHDLGFLLARIGLGRHPAPSHVELTRRMITQCSPTTRREAVRALMGYDVADRLGDIHVPTLILCGTADVLTPPAESRLMADRIPGARVEWLPGGGHMLMLERSERVDELVASFAREVGAENRDSGAREAGSAAGVAPVTSG